MSEKFKPFEWDEKLQGIPKSKIILYDCTFARKKVLHVIPLSLKKSRLCVIVLDALGVKPKHCLSGQ